MGLHQINDNPTRGKAMLDVLLTHRPYLVVRTHHDIVLIDSRLKSPRRSSQLHIRSASGKRQTGTQPKKTTVVFISEWIIIDSTIQSVDEQGKAISRGISRWKEFSNRAVCACSQCGIGLQIEVFILRRRRRRRIFSSLTKES